MRIAGVNGMAYGIGSTEENTPQEYATNMGMGAMGNILGQKSAYSIYGRGVSPLTSSLFQATASSAANAPQNRAYLQNQEDEEWKKNFNRY